MLFFLSGGADEKSGWDHNSQAASTAPCYSKTFNVEGCECDESLVSFGLILLAGSLGQTFQCVGLG